MTTKTDTARSLRLERSVDTHPDILYGLGDAHLQVVLLEEVGALAQARGGLEGGKVAQGGLGHGGGGGGGELGLAPARKPLHTQPARRREGESSAAEQHWRAQLAGVRSGTWLGIETRSDRPWATGQAEFVEQCHPVR